MQANSANGFLVGDKMTWADVALFSMLSLLVCGFIAGKLLGHLYALVCR